MAETPAEMRPLDKSLSGVAATEDLARRVARVARVGDAIGLSGELGAGKTTFARAFVAAIAVRAGQSGGEEVPSPTFTLVQTYAFGGLPVCHIDLYRLERPEEAYELGIEEAFAETICLIEWPERLGPLLPGDRLDIAFAFGTGEEDRDVRITGFGAWRERMKALAGDG